MKDKKAIKISLGTTIYIFLIILVVINLGTISYVGIMNRREKIAQINKNEKQNQINTSRQENVCTVK